jgi:hypothetical protein
MRHSSPDYGCSPRAFQGFESEFYAHDFRVAILTCFKGYVFISLWQVGSNVHIKIFGGYLSFYDLPRLGKFCMQ